MLCRITRRHRPSINRHKTLAHRHRHTDTGTQTRTDTLTTCAPTVRTPYLAEPGWYEVLPPHEHYVHEADVLRHALGQRRPSLFSDRAAAVATSAAATVAPTRVPVPRHGPRQGLGDSRRRFDDRSFLPAELEKPVLVLGLPRIDWWVGVGGLGLLG